MKNRIKVLEEKNFLTGEEVDKKIKDSMSGLNEKIDELEKDMKQKITVEDLNKLHAKITSMRTKLDSLGDDILRKGDISEIEVLKTLNTRIEEVVKTAMEKQKDVHKEEMEKTSNDIAQYKIELRDLWDNYKKQTDKNIKNELEKEIGKNKTELNVLKELQIEEIEEEKKNLEKLIKEKIEVSKIEISNQFLANDELRKEVKKYKSEASNGKIREEAYKKIYQNLMNFFSKLLPTKFIINGSLAKTNDEIWKLLINDTDSNEVFKMKIGIEDINVNIIDNIKSMINNVVKKDKQIWFIKYYDAFIIVSKNIVLDEVSKEEDFFADDEYEGFLTTATYSKLSSKVQYIDEEENELKKWDENGKKAKRFVVNIGGKRSFKGKGHSYKPDFKDDEIITYKDLGDSKRINILNMTRNFDSDIIVIKEVGENFNIVTNNSSVNKGIEEGGKNMRECLKSFLKYKNMTIFKLFDFNVDEHLEKIGSKTEEKAEETAEETAEEKAEEKAEGVCGEILDKLSKELQKYRVGFNLYISPK